MADRQETAAVGVNRGRLAAAAMSVSGGLLAIVVTVWAIVRFWELSVQTRPPLASDFLAPAGLLLAGWGFYALLWGAAEILRGMERVLEKLELTAGVAPLGLRARDVDAPSEHQAHSLEELVQLTRELRDIELLSEPERAARLKHESDELVRQLENDIPTLLREHNLQEAQQRLQRARRRFPMLPQWNALAGQIEQARAQFEAHDLEVATREVDDLTSLGAWDRATEVLRTLRQRHPASEQVAELARRVAVARDRATAEERARLMSQAQDATNRHQWAQALRLVETVITRFPGSAEAHELRLQLPTLRANAEIQERQELEAQIRNLLKEHRFAEARRIANQVIEQYPDSPQAHALREQILPRLRSAETQETAP
jgi:outer membrane protein assembly factor BamD (BamD/ComL family)